jgi:hypothetical protein
MPVVAFEDERVTPPVVARLTLLPRDVVPP